LNVLADAYALNDPVPGRVAVVILNWNGWRDTVECLESLLRCDYSDFRVVVCDNGSQDDSPNRIQDWADGRLDALVEEAPWAVLPPGRVPKPVICTEYARAEAEAGGELGIDPHLVLIRNGANLGFAGGNNVGLRYVLARGGFEYVWLLNNDTVIKPDSLSHLVKRMQVRPDAGMCGSTLLYYHQPGVVQAWGGGTYDKLLGVSRHLGVAARVEDVPDVAKVETDMAYVIGASMLVRCSLLRDVGLMSEAYFLYYEELDWACRARDRYSLVYAADSVVYHKEGGAIGSSHTGEPSLLSLTYLYGNRLRVARKHFPMYWASQWLRMAFECVVFLKRKRFATAKIIFRALLGLLPLPGTGRN
jgi:hypothetical protein